MAYALKNWYPDEKILYMITFFTLFASLLITTSSLDYYQGRLSIFTTTQTLDKRDYYIVNDVFAHKKSRDELARYIRNY